METKATFTLNRDGDFTIKTEGPNHCGTSDVLTIKYHVKVVCSVDSLDSRGFLFDQMNVVKFFASQKVTNLSCEQYTLTCARKLFALIRAENNGCKVKVISLTLSPAPFAASMTFDWER